jgi:hypothetical protein
MPNTSVFVKVRINLYLLNSEKHKQAVLDKAKLQHTKYTTKPCNIGMSMRQLRTFDGYIREGYANTLNSYNSKILMSNRPLVVLI